MKRITYWPQGWLGIAINFGAVVSWLSLTGAVDYALMGSLLFAMWSWTILYGAVCFSRGSPPARLTAPPDTIYACQDKVDDLKVGVRSTAILFGAWIRPLLTLFGVAFVGALTYAGFLNEQSAAFYMIAVGGTFAHLVWQYVSVDLDNPMSCKRQSRRPRLAIDVPLTYLVQ
jgi:4-hydroxybenzoate polyprenyltransferase